MSEQAKRTTDIENAPEPTTTPQVAPLPPADGELSDTDLDKVAGGFGPAPMRKSGKGQMEYLIP
jgi:hypothetical protein